MLDLSFNHRRSFVAVIHLRKCLKFTLFSAPCLLKYRSSGPNQGKGHDMKALSLPSLCRHPFDLSLSSISRLKHIAAHPFLTTSALTLLPLNFSIALSTGNRTDSYSASSAFTPVFSCLVGSYPSGSNAILWLRVISLGYAAVDWYEFP